MREVAMVPDIYREISDEVGLLKCLPEAEARCGPDGYILSRRCAV
jgi:hypothetical protein